MAYGLAAGTLGLGVAQVVAGVVAPASAPLVALGAVVVDSVPPAVKDAAIATFGTHDKQVLLGGAVLIAALLSALAGWLTGRGHSIGLWLVVALGALAALAAATRRSADMLAVLPSVAGTIVGTVALARLASARRQENGDTTRRTVLEAGVIAAGGLLAVGGGQLLGRTVRNSNASRREIQLPTPASSAPSLPAGVEVGVDGMPSFRTANEDFYRIDTALVVPRLVAAEWSLRVHGMVEREVTLRYSDLVAGPLVERDLTLICVSNEVGGHLTGNARWLGLPVASVLARARPTADADMVLSKSSDGWTASTPLPVLTDARDALLAIGMNGEPLPIEHGFPVRMVVPGLYGYVSATKWVVDLEVTRFDRATAYWTTRGWSARGPVKTQSRIDVPRAGERVTAGRVAVAGIAWAQHRGIDGVEVRVDEGPWRPARLAAEASVDTWRQWVWEWDAAPGRHTLQVRAIDGTGAVQTGEEAPPPPDGATGWHTIDVDVV